MVKVTLLLKLFQFSAAMATTLSRFQRAADLVLKPFLTKLSYSRYNKVTITISSRISQSELSLLRALFLEEFEGFSSHLYSHGVAHIRVLIIRLPFISSLITKLAEGREASVPLAAFLVDRNEHISLGDPNG
jgi:hypothetical protein